MYLSVYCCLQGINQTPEIGVCLTRLSQAWHYLFSVETGCTIGTRRRYDNVIVLSSSQEIDTSCLRAFVRMLPMSESEDDSNPLFGTREIWCLFVPLDIIHERLYESR